MKFKQMCVPLLLCAALLLLTACGGGGKQTETPASPAALADGTYEIGVALEGGTGRATVRSPATLRVGNGAATAVIIWSSSNYDYMLVDGVQYAPLTLTGGAAFEIPVRSWELPVTADTTAMGSPHEISYILRFDAASVAPVAP